ncbi:MAG: DUF1571 domain-containing protein, partial [Nitrospinota bacterium]
MSYTLSGWWRRLSLVICIAALFWTSSLARSGSASAGESPDPYQLILSTRASFESVRDYTATFTKQERINGTLRPPEVIFLKFQRPFKVYMKWVDGAKEGQEVLYVKGQNGGRILAHPWFGGFVGEVLTLILPTFALSPDGPTALRDSRHPITRAGIGMLIEKIVEVNSLALARGDLSLSFQGEGQVDGRPAAVVDRILPQKEGYPAHRTRYYIDKEYNLPVRVVLHDWTDQLTAYYEYSALV